LKSDVEAAVTKMKKNKSPGAKNITTEEIHHQTSTVLTSCIIFAAKSGRQKKYEIPGRDL